MVHLRLVAPAETVSAVLERLDRSRAVINIIHLRGAARRPDGDVVMCDLAREDASVVIADLRALHVDRDGSIAVEYVDTSISSAADHAEQEAEGSPADAVIWEDVAADTSESAELSGAFQSDRGGLHRTRRRGEFSMSEITQSTGTDGDTRASFLRKAGLGGAAFVGGSALLGRPDAALAGHTDSYNLLIDIRDHEITHVDFFVGALGKAAVGPCKFNFSTALKDVGSFLATAQLLENTGAMAYEGAIRYVDAGDNLQAGAQIATVEARHAAYLNLINRESPFPAAFDTGKKPSEIVAAAKPFIVSCPKEVTDLFARLP